MIDVDTNRRFDLPLLYVMLQILELFGVLEEGAQVWVVHGLDVHLLPISVFDLFLFEEVLVFGFDFEVVDAPYDGTKLPPLRFLNCDVFEPVRIDNFQKRFQVGMDRLCPREAVYYKVDVNALTLFVLLYVLGVFSDVLHPLFISLRYFDSLKQLYFFN